MSNISKKTFIYVLCGWLAFSSAFITYQKSYSYAMEWAGVTIALDTALKALLGTIGITAGVGMASEVDWGAVRNDCISFQENQGNSAVEVGEWWSDIISGSLNTASGCWDSFKEWAVSLTATESGGGGGSAVDGVNSTVFFNALANYLGGTCTFNDSYTEGIIYGACLEGADLNNLSNNLSKSWRILTSPSPFAYNRPYINFNSLPINFCFQGISTVGFNFENGNYYRDNGQSSNVNLDGYASTIAFNSGSIITVGFDQTIGTNTLGITWDDLGISVGGETDTPVTGGLFQAIDNSVINNLDIINQGDTVIEGDTIINLPWERVGDTASAVDDVIQGLIDRVNDGTLSLDNYTENIQNITNTYVYETTNNHIFPDPDNTDDTIDDKINENKSNVGFTLFGLERFFPFCIPWDIYAFLGLLEAEPQAPQINIPFPDPVTKEVDVYVLDLSPLEPVATVLRYGFDLIFIIGLALATRRLIGAGGD